MWSSDEEIEAAPIKKRRISPNSRFQSISKRREKTNATALESVLAEEPSSDPYYCRHPPETSFEAKLLYWKEFCGAQHYATLYQEVKFFSRSLPKMLLSKRDLFDTLSSYLVPEAELSLQAIADVMVGFSRDLQDGFTEFVPELIVKISTLCHGLLKSPEIVGQIFSSLGVILKQMKKYLVFSLGDFLTIVMQPLIVHASPFVQKLTSQILAPLLRQISSIKLKLSVKHILGCVCKKRENYEALINGYSCVLSYVCLGAQNTLHSKAEELLELLFRGDLLQTSNFRCQSASSTALEWITDDFIQDRLFSVIQCCANDYLLKQIDQASSKRLWKTISTVLEEKIGLLKGALAQGSLAEARKILRNLACLIYISTRLLTLFGKILVTDEDVTFDWIRLMNGDDIFSKIKMTDQQLLEPTDRGIGSEIQIVSFCGQISSLLVVLSGLMTTHHSELNSRVNVENLEAYFEHLAPSELLYIAKKTTSAKIYFHRIFDCLAQLLMEKEDNLFCQHHELAFVLIWRMLAANLSGAQQQKYSSFADWLKETVHQWPNQLCSRTVDSLAIIRFGTLAAKCLSTIFCDQPSLIMDACRRMLDQLEKLAQRTREDNFEEFKSALSFQLKVIMTEAAVKTNKRGYYQERSSGLVSTLKESLEEELKTAQIDVPKLKYVSWILNLISQDDQEFVEQNFAMSDGESWIHILEPSLANCSKQIRFHCFEILAHFDALYIETFKLFSTFLEIENGDFCGIDRRSIRQVEMIYEQVHQRRIHPSLLSPCFYGLLGLLNIPFQPIWATVTSSMSSLLVKDTSQFWPLLIQELKSCQEALLTSTISETGEKEIDQNSSFIRAFDEDVLLLIKQDPITDNLTKMLHLLQAIEGISPSQLEKRVSEWIPMMLKWMRMDSDVTLRANQRVVSHGEWVKGMKAWLKTMSILPSLEQIESHREKVLDGLMALLLVRELQSLALKILSKFDLKFLPPYMIHLSKMTEARDLRSEFLNFPLAVDSKLIEKEHRAALLPVLTKILFPHIKSLKSKKQKSDPVLDYLSGAESSELLQLIVLIFADLDTCFVPSCDVTLQQQTSDRLVHDEKWWSYHLMENSVVAWIERINVEALEQAQIALTISKVECLLFNLGCKIIPYLAFMVAFVVCALKAFCVTFEDSFQLIEDILLLLSSVFDRFPESLDYVATLELLIPIVLNLFGNLQTSSQPHEPCGLLLLIKSIAGLPCFKTLMERNQISTLLQSLLKHTFEILSRSTTSDKTISLILEVVQCCLEKEINMSENILKLILQGIHAHIISRSRTHNKNQDIIQDLKILEGIHDLNKNQEITQTLANTLTSVLSSKNEAHVMKTLDCLACIWDCLGTIHESTAQPVFSSEELARFGSTLAKKALQMGSVDGRLSLSRAVTSLANVYPSVKQSAQIFGSLVSFVPNQVEGIDYERRLEAYESLTEEFWTSQNDQDNEILIYACLHDLQTNSDFSIRQGSTAALLRLILSFTAEDKHKKMLFDQLCKKLGSNNLAIQQDHLILLSKIMEVDGGVMFPSHTFLYEANDDLDFFRNVAHFQISRRMKAWQRVLKKLKNQTHTITLHSMEIEKSEIILKCSKILFPLLFQAIFDGQVLEKRSKKQKIGQAINQGKESSLVEICARVLSVTSSFLPWTPYRKLLNQIISRVKTTVQPNKGMIRALCTVIDSFEFQSGSKDVDNLAEEEQNSLFCNKVLPFLDSLLFSKSREAASLPVAVSLAKLYQKLKETDLADLKGILMKLSRLLLHRVQHLRDDSREVFVSVAAALGCTNLHLVLNALLSTLPLKGYTAHVLDYTIHAVLNRVLKEDVMSVEVDRVVDIVSPVITATLFGDPAEARAMKQFSSKYKEAKSTKAFEIFQLLCKACTLPTTFPALVAYIKERLSECTSPKHLKIVEQLLEQGVHGIVKNASSTLGEKLNMIHTLVHDQKPKEIEKNAPTRLRSMLEEMENSVFKQKQENIAKYGHLLKAFGLKLFRKCLKQISSRAGAPLDTINTFIPLLMQCLRSTHGTVSSLALKSLCLLISFPLPFFQDHASEAGRAVIHLLDTSSNLSTDSIAQDCLKLLGRMLNAGDWFNPTSMQVNSLLTLIHSDLEEQSDLQSALKLLRAIVDRKITTPRVYDLMINVRELVIRSQSSQMREMGSSLYLQFLLNYPMASKQVEQHLLFILANLAYEYETGRLKALELLNQVMMKFPCELLVEKCLLFYIPLVKRLGEETMTPCKTQLVKALKYFLGKLDDAKSYVILIKVNFEWIQNPSSELKLVGFQGMSIFLETCPQACSFHINEITTLLYSTLSQMDEETEWKEVYLALHLMEKLCLCMEVIVEGEHPLMEEGMLAHGKLWTEVVEMLDFPHAWVRAASSRLLSQAFAFLEKRLDSFLGQKEKIIIGKKSAPELAFSCYVMLESDTMDEKSIKQCTKNLVWLSPILHIQSSSVPPKTKDQDPPENDIAKSGSGLSLMGMVGRMVKLAELRSENKNTVRLAALKFLGALFIRLKHFNFVNPYLSLMLQPLYRIVESKDLRDTEQEARNVAQEVMEYIKSLVSGDLFRESYFKARQAVEESRKKRKTKEALQKVMHPQSAAKRKLTQHRKKSKLRKQKKWKQSLLKT